MKKVWFIRHAKSSWKNPELTDHQRPLNKRGKRDAPRMSSYIAERYPPPQLLVSSTAKRALRTARAFRSAFDMDKSMLIKTDELYHASSREVKSLLAKTDDAFDYIAVFGHNPTFTEIVNDLTGSSIWNVPTCGCALVRSHADNWSGFANDHCELEAFLFPKMFDSEN